MTDDELLARFELAQRQATPETRKMLTDKLRSQTFVNKLKQQVGQSGTVDLGQAVKQGRLLRG